MLATYGGNNQMISIDVMDINVGTYAMYKEGITIISVITVRRKGGNCKREANMRKTTRGVVNSADWYAATLSMCGP